MNPGAQVVAHVIASRLLTETLTQCELVLTRDVLSLFSVSDDIPLRTFAVVDVDCRQATLEENPGIADELNIYYTSSIVGHH